MKTVNTFRKGILFYGATLMIAILVSSCATKAIFVSSAVVPAAQGYVKVKSDKNRNYLVKVELKNLAPSSRLQPSKNMYVVWMMSNDNATKNIGQVVSATTLLSKELQGSLETVTTLKPVKIFITAEDNANTEYPDSRVVLTTKFF